MSLKNIFYIFLELDQVLVDVVSHFGSWTYLLLFIVIFCETGLVFTPFLPGDSLLFMAGTLAAIDSLNPFILTVVLIIAAIFGDTVNYWIGRTAGIKFFQKNPFFRIKEEHLKKTEYFYKKYGAKTIVLARFVPIVRTIAPFVAGVGKMNYREFLIYNIFGGIIWVTFFVGAGYFFGNIPIVKDNLTLAILLIIFLSILPGLIEFFRERKKERDKQKEKHDIEL